MNMEYRKFEQREAFVESGIFTQDELKKYITEENPFFLKLKDTRFLPVKDGGVFKYFNYVDDLRDNAFAKEKFQLFFPYIKEKDMIVALAKLTEAKEYYFKDNTFFISFVSVDPQFQGKGYASKLLEKIFQFAQEKNIHLQNSSYTDEGEEKLYDVVQRLREKYPDVSFQEDEIFEERRRKKEARKNNNLQK